MKKAKGIIINLSGICLLTFALVGCSGSDTTTNEYADNGINEETTVTTVETTTEERTETTTAKAVTDTSSYSSVSSTNNSSNNYSSNLQTCPSCGNKVSKLVRREVIRGNGDWQEWCQSCWNSYDEISPYSNSAESDYDRALGDVADAYGLSEAELYAAYRAKYGY